MRHSQQFTLVQLQSALTSIDANCSRQEWVEILIAIKSEFGEEGRIEAESWSKNGDNFNQKAFNSTWKSLHCKPGGISIGTLIYKAINSGWSFKQNSQPHNSEVEIQLLKRKQKRYEELKKLEAEEKQRHLAVSQEAKLLIENSPLATPNHPYLKEKKYCHMVLELLGFWAPQMFY